MASLELLCSSGALDVDVACEKHWNGAPGFYLAEMIEDATFFAARRSPGSVISVDIDEAALEQLSPMGCEQHPIPAGRTTTFAGRELSIPIEAFATFNQLVSKGHIVVCAD